MQTQLYSYKSMDFSAMYFNPGPGVFQILYILYVNSWLSIYILIPQEVICTYKYFQINLKKCYVVFNYFQTKHTELDERPWK